MSKHNDELAALLDEVATDAEVHDELGFEPDLSKVKVTRGGPRTRVLQVRLNDDELATLEQLAKSRGLPPSTLARELVLSAINPSATDSEARERIMAAFRAFVDTVEASAARRESGYAQSA